MNEIDAVKVLECMAIDMMGALAGLSKKEPLADVLCQRIEAINLAQSALREKAEREKGCEYCNPNPYGHGEAIKPLIRQVFNDKAQICTKISGDGLHTLAVPSSEDTSLAKRYSKCQIINYCPMCGKRLEVEP